MPRLREVPRPEVHESAQPIYQMLFGDRDPTREPGTGTGTSGDWWSVFALVPDVFDHAVAGFEVYRSPARKLDPKLRELGQMRVGYACGSQFVFSQHSKAARDAGVTEEQIAAIPAWQVASCFTPLERALLATTDALALDRGRVPDRVFAALRAELSDEEILEFCYVIAMYAMHAALSRALRLEYDDVDERVVEIPAPSGETGLEGTLHTPPGD